MLRIRIRMDLGILKPDRDPHQSETPDQDSMCCGPICNTAVEDSALEPRRLTNGAMEAHTRAVEAHPRAVDGIYTSLVDLHYFDEDLDPHKKTGSGSASK